MRGRRETQGSLGLGDPHHQTIWIDINKAEGKRQLQQEHLLSTCCIPGLEMTTASKTCGRHVFNNQCAFTQERGLSRHRGRGWAWGDGGLRGLPGGGDALEDDEGVRERGEEGVEVRRQKEGKEQKGQGKKQYQSIGEKMVTEKHSEMREMRKRGTGMGGMEQRRKKVPRRRAGGWGKHRELKPSGSWLGL